MNKEMKNYGLETVLRRIKLDNFVPFKYQLREHFPDFEVHEELNPKFIDPVLSEVP